MQGILKCNHQKLYDCLQEAKMNQPFPNQRLNELEAEWQSVFVSYQHKMVELKLLIYAYEEKEKQIRNEIKRIRKSRPVVANKVVSFVLEKIVILIFSLSFFTGSRQEAIDFFASLTVV